MSDRESTNSLSFDTLRPGDRFQLGTYALTRDEVVDFAARYDPQPFHLDDAAAAANPIFGRISASGWHSALIMHLLWDRFVKTHGLKSVAGLGVDEIRWIRPVHPGDLLEGAMEVLGTRRSRSNPARGVMTVRTSLSNQDGERVATQVSTALYEIHSDLKSGGIT